MYLVELSSPALSEFVHEFAILNDCDFSKYGCISELEYADINLIEFEKYVNSLGVLCTIKI